MNWVRSVIGLLAAVGVSLVIGGLTSYGQTFLPDAVGSVVNSSSGWTLVTALAVWCTREQSLLIAATTGAASFAALNLGYQLTSTARGFFYSGETWFLVAVATGPAIGMAASRLHRRDLLGGIGTGLLAGIGLSDGLNGLLFLPTGSQRVTSSMKWTERQLLGPGHGRHAQLVRQPLQTVLQHHSRVVAQNHARREPKPVLIRITHHDRVVTAAAHIACIGSIAHHHA